MTETWKDPDDCVLYDADFRTAEPIIAEMSSYQLIPHPLKGIQYADGIGS